MKRMCMPGLLAGLILLLAMLAQAVPVQSEDKAAVPDNAFLLENFTPAEVAAFIKIHDFKATRGRFLETPLGKLWSETSFKDVFLPMNEVWERYKNKKQKAEGLNLDDLQKLFQGQVALALSYGEKKEKLPQELRWVCLAEVDPAGSLLALQAYTKPRAESLEKSSVKGVDIWTHKNSNVSFALNGPLFLLGDSSLELTRFIERAEKRELTLGASDKFKNAAKNISRGDVNYYIFACENLFEDSLSGMIGEPKENLKRYGPVYGNISFDKRGVNDNIFIAVNGEIPETFKLLTQGEGGNEFQKLLPATAPLATFFDVKFKKQIQELREISVLGEMGPNQLLGLLEAESEKNAHLFDDFSGKYLVFFDAERQGQTPAPEMQVVQMVGFRDQDSARKFIFDYFKNLTGGESREQRKAGRGLVFFDKEKNSDVTLGLLDNYVLCGDLQALEQFLNSPKNLGEMPGVQTALNNLSAPDSPWRAYKPVLYFSPQKAAELFLYFAMAEEGPDLIESGFNLAAFPTRREIQERLSDGFLCAAPAEGGVKLLLQGPVINPLLIFFAAGVMEEFDVEPFEAESDAKDPVEKKVFSALRQNLFRLDGFEDSLDQLATMEAADRAKVAGLIAGKIEGGKMPERLAAAGLLNSLSRRADGETALLKKLVPDLVAALDDTKIWKSLRIEAFYVLATSTENFRKDPAIAEKIRASAPVFTELANDPILFPADRKLLIDAALACNDNQALLDAAFAVLKEHCFSEATDDFTEYASRKALTFACQTPDGQTVKFVMEHDPQSKETTCDEVVLPAPTEEQKTAGHQILIISDRSGQRLKLDATFGKKANVVDVDMIPVDKNGKILPDKKVSMKFLDAFSRELKINFTREDEEEPFDKTFALPNDSDLWKVKARKQ